MAQRNPYQALHAEVRDDGLTVGAHNTPSPSPEEGPRPHQDERHDHAITEPSPAHRGSLRTFNQEAFINSVQPPPPAPEPATTPAPMGRKPPVAISAGMDHFSPFALS